MRRALIGLAAAACLGGEAAAQELDRTPLGITHDQLDDADLIDPRGRDIGDVENVMLGRNGEVVGVVVEIDQRAPKSDRRVQIDLSTLKAVPDATDPGDFNVQTSLTREQLLALPEAR